MKRGQVFDLYQDGKETVRVMAIDDRIAVNLSTLEYIHDVDFDNEVGEILIDNILTFTKDK